MSPEMETIWDIEPHTIAKHKILEEYLKAWYPILSYGKFRKAIFLDGFAGPGVYRGGEDGSPVIALRVATEHRLALMAEFRFFFIEADPARYRVLKQTLENRFSSAPLNFKWKPVQREFEAYMGGVFNSLESKGTKLAPTFAFIDPFGYTGFSMNLIGKILSYDACEVLINFMEDFVNRFTDPLHEEGLDELYGTTEWRKVRNITDPIERKNFLLKLYEDQLKKSGAKYVRSFEMVGDNGHTIYYLVFATKHPSGMKVMKDAMWKVDRTGSFKFSDRTNPSQRYLLDYTDEKAWVDEAINMVLARFAGKTALYDDIVDFVIADTPYRYQQCILNTIRDRGLILDYQPKTGRGAFKKGCAIKFALQTQLC